MLPTTQFYKNQARTSLVVQCLRVCTPNAGVLGLIPGWATRSHILQLGPSLATYINKIYAFEKEKQVISHCSR